MTRGEFREHEVVERPRPHLESEHRSRAIDLDTAEPRRCSR